MNRPLRLALLALLLPVTAWANMVWAPGPGWLAPMLQRLATALFLATGFSLAHPGTITTHALVADVRRRPGFWLLAGVVFVGYLASAHLPEVFRRWGSPVAARAGAHRWA